MVLAVDPFQIDLARKGDGTNLIVTLSVTIPETYHIYAEQLRVESEYGTPFRIVGGDTPVQLQDAFSGGAKASYTNNVILQFRSVLPVAPTESLKVSYQGCSDDQCFFPKTRVFKAAVSASLPGGTVIENLENGVGPALDWRVSMANLKPVVSASGYLNAKDFIKFLDRAEGREDRAENPVGLVARMKVAFLLFSANPLEFFKIYGVYWTVLIILGGGLMLNLTPCVLPMIPINLAIIGVGVKPGFKAKGFFLGGAYGVGIALTYGFLGVLVVLTGSQFGLLNSMPWFNVGIAIVFIVLALAMFDVFALDMSRFQRVGAGPDMKQGKVMTALFMGGVSALLAGACVAPVVIAVLLLSSNLYAQGASVGLLLPFILGAGMALPWPFAGAGLSFLPKPGVWMTWVKTGFGILILMFAFYYFSLAYHGWWGRSAVRTEAGVYQISGNARDAWKNIVDASVKSGKPVFIDFWATWCKNCEAMELTTFKEPDVKRRLSDYIVVKFQAENLADKEIREVVDYFGVKGLPTYLILKAGSGLP